jgi:3-oxoacyl-[acyl-carrier protein] reductase
MTVALVTGASRGIGQAISERLVKQGFYVIGTATSEGGAQAISDRLGSNGEGRVLNVTDAVMVNELAKSLADADKSPLVLVNNAGKQASKA